MSDTIKGNIEGIGTTMTDYVIGKGGRQKIRLTHNGKRNFIVKLVESNSGEYDLLVNEIGEYDGNVLVNTTKGKKYYLVIDADGEWSIEF